MSGIAADALRDLSLRGKYRDVILPMTVLRSLDAMLEGSKQAVLDMRLRSPAPAWSSRTPPCARRRGRRSTAPPAPPSTTCAPARTASSSPHTSKRTSTDSRPTCRTSSTTSSSATRSLACPAPMPWVTLNEKLTSPDVNLSPDPVRHPDGSVKQPGLDNHGRGTCCCRWRGVYRDFQQARF